MDDYNEDNSNDENGDDDDYDKDSDDDYIDDIDGGGGGIAHGKYDTNTIKFMSQTWTKCMLCSVL